MFFVQSAPRGRVSSRLVPKRGGGLRSLALAVVLALASIPTAAWAKAPSPSSANVSRTGPASAANQVPATADARTAQQREYASREASATTQAKFEGGDTTIWIGGSALVVVLLVVLIVVLL